jgi:hypothetical protein
MMLRTRGQRRESLSLNDLKLHWHLMQRGGRPVILPHWHILINQHPGVVSSSKDILDVLRSKGGYVSETGLRVQLLQPSKSS